MLAREAGTDNGWAGTAIPRKAVDDLRSRVAAEVEEFLDSVFEAAQTKDSRPMNAELQQLNREIDELTGNTPQSDAALLKQIEELAGDTKATAGFITPALASVLTQAASRLAQSAVRAQAAGLPEAEAALMAASQALRTLASGGEGDVEAIVATVRPLVQEFRNAGQTVAAGNLERDLVELQGLVRFEIGNEERVEGSVDVTEGVVDSRDRYEPKGNAPMVDSRFRPIGEAAAPVPVDPGETYRFPMFTTDPYRVEDEA